MKIKSLILLSLLSSYLYAWEGSFVLSEQEQKKADFYNKFLQALSLEKNDVDEKFIHQNCRKNCRLDEINKYLDELKHPGEHVNFI